MDIRVQSDYLWPVKGSARAYCQVRTAWDLKSNARRAMYGRDGIAVPRSRFGTWRCAPLCACCSCRCFSRRRGLRSLPDRCRSPINHSTDQPTAPVAISSAARPRSNVWTATRKLPAGSMPTRGCMRLTTFLPAPARSARAVTPSTMARIFH